MVSNEDKREFEEILSSIFNVSGSNGGDEELLKTAIEFARQFSGLQVRKLLFLKAFSMKYSTEKNTKTKEIFDSIIKQYMVLQQFHGSADFVRSMFDSLSAKRFFGQDAGKINVMRQLNGI